MKQVEESVASIQKRPSVNEKNTESVKAKKQKLTERSCEKEAQMEIGDQEEEEEEEEWEI